MERDENLKDKVKKGSETSKNMNTVIKSEVQVDVHGKNLTGPLGHQKPSCPI